MPTPAAAPFADFAALAAHLDGLGLFRITPGLERVAAVLERLKLRRPPYAVVQVAGTNGKGSSSVMLDALARAHGLQTGLHTSPHFLSVRERVRVNGALLPEAYWLRCGNTLMRHGGEELSYFEFVTCLAVLAFAEAGVELAVMESGLGGRFDATTALEADLLVLTPVALDHQAVLGSSLREIAEDKAGAIRPGRPVVSASQHPEAWEAITHAARERCAPLSEAPPPAHAEGLTPRLDGDHQKENACLALAAWRMLREQGLLPRAAGEAAARAVRAADANSLEAEALAHAWLPGRMQFVPPCPPGQAAYSPCALGWPPLLLDGAHNSHGLAALGRSLGKAGIAPAAVIFSCLDDKDVEHMLPLLRALATGPIVVPPIAGNPRATDPAALAARIGLNAMPARSLREALAEASALTADRLPEVFAGKRQQNLLLICGSLYLLGEFYALRPDCLEG